MISLLLGLAHATPAGPRFRAVVQVYRSGIHEIDPTGADVSRRFRRYGREAALVRGPNGAFAILDRGRIATYDGETLRSNVAIGDRAYVAGWDGKWPVVQSKGRAYVVKRRSKAPLSKLPSQLKAIAGDVKSGFLLALPFLQGGSEYVEDRHYAALTGTTLTPLKSLGTGDGEIVRCGSDALVSTNCEFEKGSTWVANGNLWLIRLRGGAPKLLAHHDGTEWFVSQPDQQGRYWITERGYVGEVRKFFERQTVYRYTPSTGLARVAAGKGDFYAYGIDDTGQWLLGERVYGYEMGAYDLVARNVKTSEERTILHGVEEFELL